MKQVCYLFIAAIMLASCATSSVNQDAKSANIKTKLESRDFMFVANSVNPLRGSTRILNSPYDLKLKNDSLIVYLPYFGVSRSAPINQGDAGIMFTSTNFTYSFSPAKKGNWNVAFTIQDQQMTSRIDLTIFSNGAASATVISNFRDAISFSGYIKGI